MATIKTGVFTSAKGTVFTTVAMKDVVRLVAQAIGEAPEDIEKLVADPRGEFLMVWRPKAPKVVAPNKVSKGPASEATSAAALMAQMQAMMQQFAAMQAAASGGNAPAPLSLPQPIKGRGRSDKARVA